nr:hypothetical protein [Bacteroidota bacterium]
MKKNNTPPLRYIALISLMFFLNPGIKSQSKESGTKVNLYSDMVTIEEGTGDAGMMVDEQELAGDPLSGSAGHPVTIWSSGYFAEYPQVAYIDFGSELELTNIFIYDSYNAANLIIEVGSPGNWEYLFTEPLTQYKKWKRHDVNVKSRYLRVNKTSSKVNFNEIVVYANNPSLPLPTIASLSIANSTPNTMLLNWVDVGGTAQTGSFDDYDLRYSPEPITAENFKYCNQFPVGFNPATAGTKQTLDVTGLTNGHRYYFAIQLIGSKANSKLSNVVTGATTVYFNEEETKVLLDPSMVVNESGMGDAGKIVDEQELSGDPLLSSGGSPVDEWSPSMNLGDYPKSAYIDLGQEKFITQIFIRDINSVGDLVFEIGIPGDWEYLFTEPCTSYMAWKQHEVNSFTRYLRLTKNHREAKFSEIVIYAMSPIFVEEKIFLDTSMITNNTGYGDAWMLVDEQDISGDPANSPGGNPTTLWQTGFQSSIPYPLHVVLDLGKSYQLSKIFLRDSYSSSEFTIWGGVPGDWELITTDNLGGYLSWNQHDVDVVTRYLQFGKASANANVNEVVIYGYDLSPGVIDSIPPARIEDLVAEYQNGNEVMINWTAPGDDGFTGTSQSYMIKYGTTPITPENFSECLLWEDSPIPLLCGEAQSLTIDGLNPDTEYFFAIQSIDDAYNFSDISNIENASTSYQIGGDPYRFTLKPSWILNEIVQGDATLLVDEQDISGDPKNGQGGPPQNDWYLGSSTWKYPGHAMIDLQGSCLITDLYIYDMDDSGEDSITPVTIYYGEPFNWQELIVDDLQNSDSWNQHIVNIETRYLRVKIHSKETRVAEILLYGTRLEDPFEEPAQQVHPFATMDQMIGVNAFIDDPIGRISVAGFVREYHSWMWCDGNNISGYPGYPNNENRFNTMGWNFDYYYENLQNAGIVTCPAIQNNVLWLTDFSYSLLSHKPVSEGENSYEPAAYAEHAAHLFQYAARYGNVQHEDSLLKLASGQNRVSGTNLLKYYENWNEQDKWWKGRGGFFDPYEYSAMTSADYDGHMGTMEGKVGVKNADPEAKLVMSGLAKPDLNYVRAMKLWSDYNRNGEFPADVINVHHYCNNGTTQSNGTIGISPEADDLKGLMTEFVEYRNKYLPGKEVWITEFGYDTHPNSVQRAPAFGSFSQEEVQGQWIVRSYLALAAAGVEKAAMYMLRDVSETSSTKFNTSGLITSGATGAQPKPSWYYVNTMKNRLDGMYFDKEIESGNEHVWIYKFKHSNDNVSAYAVWWPTSEETTVSGYELGLDVNEAKAILIELAEGKNYGIETDLVIDNQKVIVDVSERPIFIIASDGNYEFPVFKEEMKFVLDQSMVINETGFGDATRLIDEQDLALDPFMRENG